MDIHMPSIVSSPNPHNNAPQNGNGNAKEDLLALMKEKDNVEAELKALGSVLDSVCYPGSKAFIHNYNDSSILPFRNLALGHL